MKVSGINNISGYNMNVNKNTKAQNFNGLWLKTSVRTDVDFVLCVPQTTIVRYYSPFADEKPQDIQKIIDERRNASIFKDGRGNTRYIINECKLCKRLPFNEQQYEAYMSVTDKQKSNPMIEEIHSLAKDRYTTDSLSKYQKPAYNPFLYKEEPKKNTLNDDF